MEKIRQDAIIARIVHLQKRVRKWILRRRESKLQKEKDLAKELLDAALKAEEDEMVSNSEDLKLTLLIPNFCRLGSKE